LDESILGLQYAIIQKTSADSAPAIEYSK